jgi:hypothetical protein
MIQVLQGVSVTPRGSNNRFVAQNWPNSYAFGGWIYNVSTNLGFNEKPTEVTLNIVLETTTYSQTQAFFDIKKSDLHLDAGAGGLSNEVWFDLNIEGFQLQNFLLYSYDFSIENGQKILNVTFKDYSIILDKIYVGLFKKQGYLMPHSISCQLQLPIRCQDCEYTGSAITGTGFAYRDINFGCYVGNNGSTTDMFVNTYYGLGNVFNVWNQSIIGPAQSGKKINQFDLNGGYVILGTEAATEERCNSAPNINYSFIELLSTLRLNGLSFSGSFPSGTGDSDFVYRNNYNGNLREVLSSWCSDLAYTFYTSGRTFIGINLQNPIDISALSSIADPTTALGQYFEINSSGSVASGGNSAILSFKSKTSLENTFMQAVVCDNSYPITDKQITKSVKKYVGITPLHPTALNQINSGIVSDKNLYGTPFSRSGYEIPWFDSGFDSFGNSLYSDGYFANFARLDGRSYNDLDAAIALSNYDDTLRELFVAQRCLFNAWDLGGVLVSQKNWTPEQATNNGDTFWPLDNAYCRANFAALGIFPIMEITNSELKTNIVYDNFKNAEKDGIANINTDQRYFRVFLGYYYEDLKNDITTWEKNAARSMYKYGVVTQGPLTGQPFAPINQLDDISPTAGFYGASGLVYSRIQNSFTPETNRYQDVKYAPYLDVMLYSGYVASTGTGVYYTGSNKYNPFIPPGFSDYPGRLPTGLWISTLDNDWGTLQETFQTQLAFNLNDPCAEQYTLDQGVSQILTETDRTMQDWRLEYFKPIINPDLSTIAEIIQSDQFNFSGIADEIWTTYTTTRLIKKKECKKLHIIVIPDTLNHPNIQLTFSPQPVNANNTVVLRSYKQKLYDADLRKNTTETPSICSISLLDEMCRNVLSGASGFSQVFNPSLTNQQTGCVILEDKNNYMLEGFSTGILFGKNSRTLDISITKNPNRNIYPTFDENGDYYYADLNLGNLSLDNVTVNGSIVYPIQSLPGSIANYSGIYESEITTEYRIPSFTQVFGTPVNQTGNNTSSFKFVNNTVDNLLDPILDPLTNQVKSFITVLDGSGSSIIKSPQDYYNYVKNLNSYNLTEPTKEVNLTLAGPPKQFGAFVNYLSPASGLQSLTLSVSDNGVKTDLVFADRPKVLPKPEALLNKIGARIKGTYN